MHRTRPPSLRYWLSFVAFMLAATVTPIKPAHALSYTSLYQDYPNHQREQAAVILPDDSERGWRRKAEALLMRWNGQTGLIVSPPGKGLRWLIKPNALELRASWPGQHFWRQTKRGDWEHWAFDDHLEKIRKVDNTPYSRIESMYSVQGVVAGIRPGRDGKTDLDIISTMTGEVLRAFAGVNPRQPLAEMDGVFAVQSSDFLWRVAVLDTVRIDGHTAWPRDVNFLPDIYVYAGKVAALNVAVRAGDPGSSVVDVFMQGRRYTPAVGKELAGKAGIPRGARLADEAPRMVLLRDGDPTPPEDAALDLPLVQAVLDMRARQGRPVGWAVETRGADGQPAYHLVKVMNDQRYRGKGDSEYPNGVFFMAEVGHRDVQGSSVVYPPKYLYNPIAYVSDGKAWQTRYLGIYSDPGDEVTGWSGFSGTDSPVNGKGIASLEEAKRLPVEYDIKAKMSPAEIATARKNYEIQRQRMLDAARAAYMNAVAEDEARRRAAAAAAAAAHRAEMAAAFGSITNSLVRGATSTSPSGPPPGVNQGIYNSREDSTGAGANSYYKALERERSRKLRCRSILDC